MVSRMKLSCIRLNVKKLSPVNIHPWLFFFEVDESEWIPVKIMPIINSQGRCEIPFLHTEYSESKKVQKNPANAIVSGSRF